MRLDVFAEDCRNDNSTKDQLNRKLIVQRGI